MESFLQSQFQFVFVCVIFTGTRNPSIAQWNSLYISLALVTFALTKAFMTPRLWNSKEKSLIKKVKDISWVLALANLLVHHNDYMIMMGVTFLIHCYDFLTPNQTIIYISLSSFSISCDIFLCIFLFKTSFNQLKQTRLICLLISMKFLKDLIISGIVGSMTLPSYPFGGNGVFAVSYCEIGCGLLLVAFFAYAAFAVSKFRDIWDLDVVSSNHICSIPDSVFSATAIFSQCVCASIYNMYSNKLSHN